MQKRKEKKNVLFRCTNLSERRIQILEQLALGLSQRQIIKSIKTSSHKVIAVRRFCNERSLTFEDALKLSDDELSIKNERR